MNQGTNGRKGNINKLKNQKQLKQRSSEQANAITKKTDDDPAGRGRAGEGKERKMVTTYKSVVIVVLSLNATARAFAPSSPKLLLERL